jgi:hypothetical protein
VTFRLPLAYERRGALLLTGRLDVRDAHPLEVAYATRHILTNQSLDADTWRRSREDVALRELQASLGRHPFVFFGEAALKAVLPKLPATACRRCRANMLAKVYRLRPPGFDEATSYLLGECDRCKPKPRPTELRAGGAARSTSTSNGAVAPSARITSDAADTRGVSVDELPSLLGGAGMPWGGFAPRASRYGLRRGASGEWRLYHYVKGRRVETDYVLGTDGRWWRDTPRGLVATGEPGPRSWPWRGLPGR